MKLLSFVGTGNLKETTYCLRERTKRTAFIQEALCDFYPVDSAILFTTRDAKQKNYPAISALVPDARAVHIPEGQNEAELWEIFTLVEKQVEPGDEIIFDITHGFRSLPFIAFLSSAYLRDIRKATLRGVVYGAFEARDEQGTPIFDLSPFVGLLDWMGGVHSFMNHGDAGPLQAMIREVVACAHKDGSQKQKPVKLAGFANQLESFTLATRLSQPIEAIEVAEKIIQTLPSAMEEIGHFAPPLGPVLDQIEGISQFVAPSADTSSGISIAHLHAQRDLIRYQIERGLYMQAVSLAREWMVTLFLFYAGDVALWLDPRCREAAEKAMSGGVKKRQGKVHKPTVYTPWFESLDGFETCAAVWDTISSLRNDIDHCGMRMKKTRAKRMKENVQEVPGLLERMECAFAAGVKE